MYYTAMNKLDTKKRTQIIACLVEGNSIRATCRMTGAAKGTVLKLLCDIGKACAKYQNKAMKNLPCKRLQCDEIWSFCHTKGKNLPKDLRGEPDIGDIWTWTAICADTKLVPSWMIGKRDLDAARTFITDLSSRLTNRVQLTTDGHTPYIQAVEEAFGSEIDYAMLIKIYGKDRHGKEDSRRVIGAKKTHITGKPKNEHVSTSFCERQNLTMRMSMRRFTRLTNGFSKKVENLMHAVSLHFMYYNFVRIHQSLRVTPAMEAGISERVWTLEDIVNLLK